MEETLESIYWRFRKHCKEFDVLFYEPFHAVVGVKSYNGWQVPPPPTYGVSTIVEPSAESSDDPTRGYPLHNEISIRLTKSWWDIFLRRDGDRERFEFVLLT